MAIGSCVLNACTRASISSHSRHDLALGDPGRAECLDQIVDRTRGVPLDVGRQRLLGHPRRFQEAGEGRPRSAAWGAAAPRSRPGCVGHGLGSRIREGRDLHERCAAMDRGCPKSPKLPKITKIEPGRPDPRWKARRGLQKPESQPKFSKFLGVSNSMIREMPVDVLRRRLPWPIVATRSGDIWGLLSSRS